jgi:hypothetical protein
MPKRHSKRKGSRKFSQNFKHQLSAWVDLTTGLSGLNGIRVPIGFTYFDGFSDLVKFFHYVRPIRFRISLSMSTTTATTDSFYGSALAFYPIDYIIESTPSVLPPTAATVKSLRGSVLVEPGSRNIGKWVSFQETRWYSGPDIMLIGPNLGVVLAYLSDAGVSESLGIGMLDVEFEFKSKVFLSGVLLYPKTEVKCDCCQKEKSQRLGGTATISESQRLVGTATIIE